MTRAPATSAPTQARAIARRRQILDVATAVFAEKGILAATVRDISERVGMHSGSLYHHFASKEEMIAAILAPVVASQIDAFDRIVATTDDPVAIVRGVIAAAVVQTATAPGVARILHQDAHHLSELPGLGEVLDHRRAMRERVESAVQRGVALGRFRADADVRITSTAIFDVVLTAFRHLPPMGTQSPELVSEQLTALIIDGLVTR